MMIFCQYSLSNFIKKLYSVIASYDVDAIWLARADAVIIMTLIAVQEVFERRVLIVPNNTNANGQLFFSSRIISYFSQASLLRQTNRFTVTCP